MIRLNDKTDLNFSKAPFSNLILSIFLSYDKFSISKNHFFAILDCLINSFDCVVFTMLSVLDSAVQPRVVDDDDLMYHSLESNASHPNTGRTQTTSLHGPTQKTTYG